MPQSKHSARTSEHTALYPASLSGTAPQSGSAVSDRAGSSWIDGVYVAEMNSESGSRTPHDCRRLGRQCLEGRGSR